METMLIVVVEASSLSLVWIFNRQKFTIILPLEVEVFTFAPMEALLSTMMAKVLT